ncbi:MAG TPA: folylpolyglutamate synthase/dihydrofolate synthase family protein [bacterium]|jgi:dihydrofolate synthase/folylpolyglutamate synthase|nr:folylpolyglutamate synthase/dihydrofolate synthase family protein [bacterium]
MTYDDALAFINGLLDRGNAPPIGYEERRLRRMEDLLARLGDPHRRLRTVLVAGTKGKGSTAIMLSSILEATGRRVGLYTKPHLVDYRERIRINGALISPTALADGVARVRPHVEAMRSGPFGRPTYFEVAVALAMEYFVRKAVDLAVMEVGLGGRLDATNVAEPILSILTPVSFDHMEVLGETLASITREKAGIIRPHGMVVSAPQAPEALAEIIGVCNAQDATLIVADEIMQWRLLHTRVHDQTFRLRSPSRDYGTLTLPLVGTHQLENAATAVAAAEALSRRGVSCSEEAVRVGLAALRWPARVEVIRERPAVVLDVAHNPASIAALRHTLEALFPRRRFILVFGMVATHDHRASTSLIAPLADTVIATTPQHVRPLPAAALAEEAARYAPAVEVIPDRFAAVDRALALAGSDDVVVITGSFFLVGDVREHLISKVGIRGIMG